jgi:hypothetical protein
MAATIRQNFERAQQESLVKAAVASVWAKYADEGNTIAPADLHSVLKELDYGRRDLALGRGLNRTVFEVSALPSDAAFALSELGFSDAALRSGARVALKPFQTWFV